MCLIRDLSLVASSHFPSVWGSWSASPAVLQLGKQDIVDPNPNPNPNPSGDRSSARQLGRLPPSSSREKRRRDREKNAFSFPLPPNAAQFSPPPPPPPARRRGGRGVTGAPDPSPLDFASGAVPDPFDSTAAFPNPLDSTAALPDPNSLDSAAPFPDPNSLDPAPAPGEERDPLRAPPALRPPRGPLPLHRHRLLARRQRQPHRRPRGALQRPLRVPHLLRRPRHGGPPLRLPHRTRGRPGPPLPLLVRRRARQGRPAPAAALRLPRHRMDHAQATRQRLPDTPRLRGLQEEVPPLLRARHRRHMVPGLLCPILGDAEGL